MPVVTNVSPTNMLSKLGLNPITKTKEKYRTKINKEKENDNNLFNKINLS